MHLLVQSLLNYKKCTAKHTLRWVTKLQIHKKSSPSKHVLGHVVCHGLEPSFCPTPYLPLQNTGHTDGSVMLIFVLLDVTQTSKASKRGMNCCMSNAASAHVISRTTRGHAPLRCAGTTTFHAAETASETELFQPMNGCRTEPDSRQE